MPPPRWLEMRPESVSECVRASHLRCHRTMYVNQAAQWVHSDGWPDCTPLAGPFPGAALLLQVVRESFGRCVCSGQCGLSHKKDMGRCPREDSPGDPLHAVPREPCDPAAEVKLGPADLIALCDDCHRRLLTRRIRDLHAAAVQAFNDSQEGLF